MFYFVVGECLNWTTVASESKFGASSQRNMIDRRVNDDVGLSNTHDKARFRKQKQSFPYKYDLFFYCEMFYKQRNQF